MPQTARSLKLGAVKEMGEVEYVNTAILQQTHGIQETHPTFTQIVERA